MGITISALGRVRLATEATFGTSMTAAMGNFIDLNTVEGTVQLAAVQEHLEPGVMQQYEHDFHNSDYVLGLKSSTLNFTTHLPATGAPTTGNTGSLFPAENTWATKKLLKALMGGAVSGTLGVGPVLALSGSTSASLTVTTPMGADMGIPGTAIAVLINGKYEARPILSSNATTIVPTIAFSANPAINAPCLFGTTFYMEQSNPTLESLQFVAEGIETNDEWMVAGCQGVYGIDITPGQLAKLTVQLKGAGWERTTGLSLTESSASVGYTPVPHMDSELIIGTGTITTCTVRNLVEHSTSTWQPTFSVIPVTSPDGQHSSNIVQWKRARGAAVTGNFVAYEDPASSTWLALDQAQTKFPVIQQIGSTSAGFILLSAPTVQLTAAPVRTDASGIYGQTISWRATNNKSIASPAEAWDRSPLAITIF